MPKKPSSKPIKSRTNKRGLRIYDKLSDVGPGPMEDVIHLRGCLEWALYDARAGGGNRILQGGRENTIVTVGRRWVLEKIGSFSNQTNAINAIAVGTDTASLGTGNTALGSEVTATLGRKTIGTFTTTNLTSNPPSWRAEVSFATDEANATLGEFGLFNTSAATAGTMLARQTTGTFSKATSNTLGVSWTVSN